MEIEKLKNLSLKATHQTIEEIVNQPIHELDDDFWAKINKPLIKELVLVSENCSEILMKGMKTSAEEEAEFIESF